MLAWLASCSTSAEYSFPPLPLPPPTTLALAICVCFAMFAHNATTHPRLSLVSFLFYFSRIFVSATSTITATTLALAVLFLLCKVNTCCDYTSDVSLVSSCSTSAEYSFPPLPLPPPTTLALAICVCFAMFAHNATTHPRLSWLSFLFYFSRIFVSASTTTANYVSASHLELVCKVNTCCNNTSDVSLVSFLFYFSRIVITCATTYCSCSYYLVLQCDVCTYCDYTSDVTRLASCSTSAAPVATAS